MKRIKKLALGAALVFAALSVEAHACGLIGCLVNQVAPGVGTALDQANDAAKHVLPVWNQIDQQATDAGRQVGRLIMGQVCRSLDGQFSGTLGALFPVGSACQIVLENGAAVLGQVLQ